MRSSALARPSLVLLVTILSRHAGAQTAPLYPSPQFAVNGNPTEVALGDIDGDGDLDLVTANFLQHSVCVLPGAGNASFGESTAIPSACCSPEALALADLNHDGFLDAAVGGPQGSGNTVVHLGDATGILGPALNVSTDGSDAVALGDVDLDGSVDLVMVASTNCSLLLGHGNGTFALPVPLDDRRLLSALAITDLGRDGIPDVVGLSRLGNALTVYSGLGSGRFDEGARFEVGPPLMSAEHFAIGDLNRDGIPDAVIGSRQYGISMALGDRRGGFLLPQLFASGGSVRRVDMGDLDGDGVLDVACTLREQHSIGVLPGRGNGLGAVKRWAVGTFPDAVALGDVNGDGRLDAVATTSNPAVTVLLGSHTGFESPRDLASAPAPFAVALGDVDGDSFADALVAHEASSAVSVLANQRNGTLEDLGTLDVGDAASAVMLGDVNGDGRADALVAHGVVGKLSLFGNTGRGFTSAATWSVGGRPASIALGDLDQDGVPEAVTVNKGSGDLSVVRLTARPLSGAVAPSYSAGVGAKDVVFADLDRDGDLDAAVANDVVSRGVSILLGDGFGRFGARTDHLATFISPTVAIGSGDLNGDGWPDVAVAGNDNPGLVSKLVRNDSGLFVPSLASSAGIHPMDLLVSDLDQDGHDDLATTDSIFGSVCVLLHRPAGGFRETAYHCGGEGGFDSIPRGLAAGLIDADRMPDLAVANLGSDVLTVILQRTANESTGPNTQQIDSFSGTSSREAKLVTRTD